MESGEGRATLWDGLGSIADHRQASGRRFELQSILGIGLGAVLAGRASLAGIARWGRGLSVRQLRAFGIERDRAPCHATYHYVFKGLDVIALERVLGDWAGSVSGEGGHVSMDGKTARGSRHGEVPGVHLLAAYSDSLQGVLGQCRVPPETNEITAALHLLKAVRIQGKVVTGDAIFAQKAVCEAVIERGGDYAFTVKANQPQLRDDIATVFAKPVSPWEQRRWEADIDRAVESGKGHGRIEHRELWSSESLNAYLAWPGVKQVCRIVRRRTVGRETASETVYAITSLSRQRAGARDLLRLSRLHWGIENKLHGVRDVTFREDACRVRAPATVQAFAAFRNTAITVIRRLGFINTVEPLEHFAEFRNHSVQIVRQGRIE